MFAFLPTHRPSGPTFPGRSRPRPQAGRVGYSGLDLQPAIGNQNVIRRLTAQSGQARTDWPASSSMGFQRDKKEGDNPPKSPKPSPSPGPPGAKPQEKPKPAPKEQPKEQPEAKTCTPKFKSLEAKTGKVSVQKVKDGCELDLGVPGSSNGVTVTGVVQVPPKCEGFLFYTQLVETCRGVRTADGHDFRAKSDGLWLDKQDPILAKKVGPGGGDATITLSDVPGQPLKDSLVRATVNDRFTVWLSWHPMDPDANAVALAQVTWSWSAQAEAKDPKQTDCTKRWSVTKQDHQGGTGKETATLPVVPSKTVPGDLQPEPGTC